MLDALAEASSTFFSSDRLASVAEIKFKGRTLVLVKPTTYMNLSGKAVNYWLQKEKIPQERLLIVTDDIALPFGTLRMRGKGSDGGHNGLKNINQLLGNTNYARLRFGVGSEFARGRQVNYVLGQWNEEEEAQLQERIEQAAKMVKSFTAIGLNRTMSDFNGK